MSEITIKSDGMGSVATVEGSRCCDGVFAIHRGYLEPGWTVTHLPTGWAVWKGLTSRERARCVARFAYALRQPRFWMFTDPMAISQRVKWQIERKIRSKIEELG